MDAPAVLGLAEQPEINQVAVEAHALLEKVCENLRRIT